MRARYHKIVTSRLAQKWIEQHAGHHGIQNCISVCHFNLALQVGKARSHFNFAPQIGPRIGRGFLQVRTTELQRFKGVRRNLTPTTTSACTDGTLCQKTAGFMGEYISGFTGSTPCSTTTAEFQRVRFEFQSMKFEFQSVMFAFQSVSFNFQSIPINFENVRFAFQGGSLERGKHSLRSGSVICHHIQPTIRFVKFC